ncbi:hypothetical protein DEJ13_08825 [Curtobacterium sp. MCLR17_007]|uniref:hypothetical protein n=1 Tax=Curtobacterium sp. MCLR17_007 TaxID=2175648 RepID=UPI0011B48CF5|nr:hypothetical protein [Curtobacterium sp. MCLR17_007]WIB61915.1 hypothetical protein DEJ13_08825 [Curtobacterium sp. MCLR17_007]
MSGRHALHRPALLRSSGQGVAARRVLGAHRAPLVAVAVVTLVAALLGGSALPVLTGLATAGTRGDVSRAAVGQRDLEATFALSDDDASPASAQRAFDALDQDLVAVRRSMPPALRSVTGAAGAYAATPYLDLDAEPSRVPASFALTSDRAVADLVRWSAGRAPRATSDPSTIEVAVSPSVQAAVDWPLGSVRTIGGGATALRLVGVYRPVDAADPTWAHVPTTLRAGRTNTTTGGVSRIGTAFTAPGSYGAVASGGRTTQAHAWFPVRPAAVSAPGRPALVDATRRFLTTRHPMPGTASGSTAFTTDLPEVLSAAAARDATVGTLAASLASGPAGALVVLAAILARLVLERADAVLRLLGARGASALRLRALAAGLVAVAAVPGAAVGAVLAWLVGRSPLGGSVPAVTPAVVAALVAVAVPCLAAAALAPTRQVGVTRRPLRLLVEGAVLVATTAAVVVSVRSGLSTSAPDGAVDPFAAVVPLLLAASGVVVALRLLPVVLARVVDRGRRRPGLAMLVGVATAARTATAQAVPLVVAVIGIAVALFATVVGSTLEDGVAQAARRSVAADVAVTSVALDADQVDRIARLPGVAAAVGVSTSDEVAFDTARGTVQATVIVADTARLARVQHGVPGALPVPTALRDRDTHRVDLVASRSLADATGRDSSVLGTDTRIVATAPDVSPFTPAGRWVLVDARNADAVTDTGSVDRVLVRTTAGARADQVASAIRSAVPSGSVVTADGVQRSLDADPRLPGTRVFALAAAVLGGVLGAGALAVATVLAGAVHRRRSALLAVSGADRRTLAAVVAAETLPLLLASLVTGLVVAGTVVATTLPAADLRSFTGGDVRPGVAVDPVLLAVVGIGVVLALAAVLAAAVQVGAPRTVHRDGRHDRRPRPRQTDPGRTR